MAYWLCVTTLDNWWISEKTNILGFKERVKTVSDIKTGDIGYIYIKKGSLNLDPFIIAKFKVISPLYHDASKLFEISHEYPEERFPQRIQIEILTQLNEPLLFKPMVKDLTFIKNKQSWGSALFGKSLISLSDNDYEIIDLKLRNRL